MTTEILKTRLKEKILITAKNINNHVKRYQSSTIETYAKTYFAIHNETRLDTLGEILADLGTEPELRKNKDTGEITQIIFHENGNEETHSL